MKFTVGWLREHLDTDATLDEITGKLTAIGLEIGQSFGHTIKGNLGDFLGRDVQQDNDFLEL
ncbi:MAG: hypothetical protein IIC12_05120, partial [Proteobacteria bacterium]|nr:hypothetical protein [Pseudomonadota bacterium]